MDQAVPNQMMNVFINSCERSNKTKSRLARHRFSQKMNKQIWGFFAVKGKKQNKKPNLFIRFLGESTITVLSDLYLLR